jgi:hypothetical protein
MSYTHGSSSFSSEADMLRKEESSPSTLDRPSAGEVGLAQVSRAAIVAKVVPALAVGVAPAAGTAPVQAAGAMASDARAHPA